LPGEPENCLIIQSGLLEAQVHDDVMNAVQSPEGQQSNDLSQVLHRKTMTDGSNMLNYLHFNKKLQKVPVSHVNLVPLPGQVIPLSDVNAEIRKIEGGYVPPKTDPSALNEDLDRTETPPEGANETDTDEEPSVAVSLIRQAELIKGDAEAMLKDAEAKIQEAYAIDPSLKPSETPKKRGRPRKSTK